VVSTVAPAGLADPDAAQASRRQTTGRQQKQLYANGPRRRSPHPVVLPFSMQSSTTPKKKTLQKFMLCLCTQSVWLPLLKNGHVAAAYVELQNGLVPGNQELSTHAANSG
jgi:hypothetical protein